ncbi:MAG: NAD(P)-binding domain-containing protein [Anaerolineales bacterium]|jgi:NADPH-dependent F420 reductase
MNITIIGAGNMARGIATRLLAAGNNVTLMGRSPEKVGDLAGQLGSAAKNGATVKTAPYGSAVSDDVVVLAVPFPADTSILREFGDKLGGRIIVNISTPFNATFDGLATPPDTSDAEEVAKVAPVGARIVKAFTTNFAGTLVAGQVAGQPLDVFIAGDDAQAKAIIAQLVEAGGMRPLDVGPLQRSRQLEGLHLLNVTLQSKLDNPWMSAIKVLT